MRRLYLIIISFITSTSLFGQIEIEYNPTTKTLHTDVEHYNRYSNFFKRTDNEVTIKLTNINTAILSAKLNPESLRRKTELPEVLKTFSPFLPVTIIDVPLMFDKAMPMRIPRVDVVIEQYEKCRKDYDVLREIIAELDGVIAIMKLQPLDMSCTTNAQNALRRIDAKFCSGCAKDKVIESISKTTDFFVNRAKLVRELINKRIDQRLEQGAGIDDFVTMDIELGKGLGYIERNKNAFISSYDILIDIKGALNTVATKYTVKGDYVRLKLSLLENNFNGKYDTVASETKLFYAKNYIRIDIAGGFFYNNLIPQNYYIDTVAKVVKKEGNLKHDVAIGALFNFHYVFSKGFQIGPCFGAAISPFDGKTKLLLGGSMGLFNQPKLGISFGYSFAKLPEISASFDQSNPKGDIKTYDNWKDGYFIGITYSLVNNLK